MPALSTRSMALGGRREEEREEEEDGSGWEEAGGRAPAAVSNFFFSFSARVACGWSRAEARKRGRWWESQVSRDKME